MTRSANYGKLFPVLQNTIKPRMGIGAGESRSAAQFDRISLLAYNTAVAESTIKDELWEAIVRLRVAEVDTPQLDAEVLLEYVLGADRTYLISHPERRIEQNELTNYHSLLERRERREPLPYITGKREFWSLEFDVTPSVLIPRPETETLVEEAISRLYGPVLIADIGVGSGAIAVALAKELPEARILGTDLSPEAMEVAAANVAKHKVGGRVTLLLGDLLEPLDAAFEESLDAIVSNPPYIPSDEIDTLQPEITRYEPRQALDGGPDGLDFHRRILDEARRFLKPGGYVLLETGAEQGEAALKIAHELGYRNLMIRKDLAKLDRVFIGVWKGDNGDT